MNCCSGILRGNAFPSFLRSPSQLFLYQVVFFRRSMLSHAWVAPSFRLFHCLACWKHYPCLAWCFSPTQMENRDILWSSIEDRNVSFQSEKSYVSVLMMFFLLRSVCPFINFTLFTTYGDMFLTENVSFPPVWTETLTSQLIDCCFIANAL